MLPANNSVRNTQITYTYGKIVEHNYSPNHVFRVVYPMSWIHTDTITIERKALASKKVFEFNNICNIMAVYIVKKHLGAGAFGSVDLVDHEEYGECVLKTMKYDTDQRRAILIKEVAMLEHLKSVDCHWNIHMLGHEEGDGVILLFLEYFTGFDLSQVKLNIEDEGDFQKWLTVASELVDAVLCIHRVGVAHRDIKLENVMFGQVDRSNVLKLVDFGSAVKTDAICWSRELLNTCLLK